MNSQATPMETDTTQNGSGASDVKAFFKARFAAGKIVKKKKPKTLKKRLVTPKNALACLNEVFQNTAKFVVTNPDRGMGELSCVSLEVNGRNFIGRGNSNDAARHAAAEAALASLVCPSGQSAGEDTTPWKSIASFAIFKLFNGWTDSKIWTQEAVPPTETKGASSGNMMIKISNTGVRTTHVDLREKLASKNENKGNVHSALTSYMPPPKVSKLENRVGAAIPGINAYSTEANKGVVKIPQPAKKIPENAATMNPVMLLNQLRPNFICKTEKLAGEAKNSFIFSITTNIDNQFFSGKGASTKKAKLDMARNAVKVLFQIDSQWSASE